MSVRFNPFALDVAQYGRRGATLSDLNARVPAACALGESSYGVQDKDSQESDMSKMIPNIMRTSSVAASCPLHMRIITFSLRHAR